MAEAAGVLAGLRVVDFGHYLPGPMAAMFLADFGADVIHVDPPGGPRCDHPMNAVLQRNKRTIQLDLKSAAGRERARALIAGADVVIENFRPGVMTRLGLDPAAARAANPRLIWCAMPGFAAADHRAGIAGWDGVVAAAAGLHAAPGWPEGGEPLYSALPLVSNFAAFIAAHRVLGAVIARARTGQGAGLEVPLFAAAFHAQGLFAEAPMSRRLSPPVAAKVQPLTGMHPTADGSWLFIDTPLRGLQAMLDRFLPGHDLVTMSDAEVRPLRAKLRALLMEKPGAEWERIGQEELKGSFTASQTAGQWLGDAHALDSETVITVDDEQFGPTRQAGFAAHLSRTGPALRWGRGGGPGAGGPGGGGPDEGWLAAPWTDPVVPLDAGERPLDGVRALDLTTLLAGPTAMRVLAQYGAEIIKLDRAGIATGDVDPLTDDDFALVGARVAHSGKRMVFVDLKQPLGQDLLAALIPGVDILHHNFTPDAAHRLGVSPEQVQARNPGILMTQMSLHSRGGWRAAYRGHDMLAQMISGMATRMGGDGKPALVATVLNDNAAGHLHVIGIMVALLHRWRTGEGQEVNAALSRTATLHQVPFLIDFAGHVADEPAGKSLGWNALERLYQASDGWFYLGGGLGRRGLLAQCPDLAGSAAVSGDELADWLAARFASGPVALWVEQLVAAGLGAHRHLSLNELALDPEAAGQQLLAVVDHTGLGPALGIGLPTWRNDGSASRELLALRRPGMDTVAVVEEAGLGHKLGAMLEAGAIATGEMPLLIATRAHGFWGEPARTSITGGFALTPELKARILAEPEPAMPLLRWRSPERPG